MTHADLQWLVYMSDLALGAESHQNSLMLVHCWVGAECSRGQSRSSGTRLAWDLLSSESSALGDLMAPCTPALLFVARSS